MVADVKLLLVWFTEIALDPLAAIGATLLAVAAPLAIVSRQVLTAERSDGPRPDLRIVKASSSDPVVSVPVTDPEQPAPAGQHWQRLTTLIASNIAAARTTTDMQAAARVKLDAADFALLQIFRDLADVMPGLSAGAARPTALPMADGRLAA
jgi:hypothetical protein